MKAFRYLFLASILSIGALTGCNSVKLPTTNYERVSFAFKGVEKSFKNPTTVKKSLEPSKKNKIGGSNTNAALSAIFSLYQDEDKQNNFLEDVEYNQPPMVQFQYLKKVLEKVGSGYEFNTKYYDTISGDVSIDIQTGQKSNLDKDKYNYAFTLGIDINIDNNNLITADVSFDIKLTKGSEEYNTKWYVAIELNYDMTNVTPNYTMTMVTENDERELPYYNHYTYEYDYVEVKDNAINEWRKFCMDHNQRLIKDSAHPTFDSYKDGVYNIDARAWYKDGVYYKNKVHRPYEDGAVGDALFNDLGLNATEINADVFYNKTGKQNSVIKTCYSEFTKIAKEDIIYSLLEKEEHGGGQQEQKAVAIMAFTGDLSGYAENHSIPGNLTVGQVFNGFIDANGEKTAIVLFYVDQHGNRLEEIKDLRSLTFSFGLKDRVGVIDFTSVDETLESAFTRLAESDYVDDADISRECEIHFRSNTDNNIKGKMYFYYAGDLPSSYVKPEWPSALKSLNIPEYDGEKMTYQYSEDSGRIYLDIRNTNYDEGEAYLLKLRKNGFDPTNAISVRPDEEVALAKQVSELLTTYIVFKYNKNTTDYLLTVWQEQTGQDIPNEQPFHVYAIGDFNNWDPTLAAEFNAFYDGKVWSFILDEFHVNANESFMFLEDPNNPKEDGFGFNKLIDDPRGMLDMDYARQPFGIKALQEVTIKFTVDEDKFLHLEFLETPGQILYLTLIGSFSNWEVNPDAIELTKQADGTFKNTFSLEANMEFKIMQNHSDKYIYGYSKIQALQSADMRFRFDKGEDDRIVTLIPMLITLTATNNNGIASFSFSITNL